jgi:glutathione S-transferase
LSSESGTGRHCHGDTPGMADCVLVPQVANAIRFKVDLTEFPTIRRIDEECGKLDAFRKAAPQNQPDAE